MVIKWKIKVKKKWSLPFAGSDSVLLLVDELDDVVLLILNNRSESSKFVEKNALSWQS